MRERETLRDCHAQSPEAFLRIRVHLQGALTVTAVNVYL